MEWEGKSKRNAVTEGGAVFILGGQRPVDPEGCKGGGISIRSRVCMICMIRGGPTRRMAVIERGITPGNASHPIHNVNYHALLDLACRAPGDLHYDWLIPLSESVIWRLFDAAQRHPRRVFINPLRFHTLPFHPLLLLRSIFHDNHLASFQPPFSSSQSNLPNNPNLPSK